MLEGDHKRKKVVIPAKLVLELIGEREIRGAFTKLAFNLIVKRKSRYYDNPVKKLSFPRKRESRGRIYKACLRLDREAEINKKTR